MSAPVKEIRGYAMPEDARQKSDGRIGRVWYPCMADGCRIANEKFDTPKQARRRSKELQERMS